MALYRVKIVQPGWETYTGPLNAVNFVDGISEDVVPRHLADRVAALVLCETIDENDESQGQAGEAARYVSSTLVPVAEIDPLDRMTPEELEAERKAALEAALTNPASTIYSQDDLEGIGGREGMKGVRAIGDKWGVKERNMTKLIALILKAQAEYEARVVDRDAAIKAQQEAAAAEALQIQKDKEAAIDAVARNLQVEAEAAAAKEAADAAAKAAADLVLKEAADAAAKAAADATAAEAAAAEKLAQDAAANQTTES